MSRQKLRGGLANAFIFMYFLAAMFVCDFNNWKEGTTYVEWFVGSQMIYKEAGELEPGLFTGRWTRILFNYS